MNLESNNDTKATGADVAQDIDRRDAVRKLGKFAAYAAPFTVLAVSAKAAQTSGGGFHPQSKSAAGSHR